MACGGALENQEELIGHIYDSVLCPDSWQMFLDRLVEGSHARSGLLVLQNTDNLDIGYTVQNGFDASMRELYNRDYRTQDLWTIGLTQLPRGQVVPSQGYVPQMEFKRSVIYNEFCRPQGIEHCAGAFITCDGPWSIRLALQRGKSQGEFSDREVQMLQRLVPHIQRSVRIGREFGNARGSLEASIEHGLIPCILMTRSRTILLTNSKARALIEHNQLGLVVVHDRITFRSSALTHRLDALVRDCELTLGRRSGRSGGMLKIPRMGRLPMIISLTPFHNPIGTSLGQMEATVALYFYDPERRVYPNAQLLLELFGLTSGETRVANQLATGQDLEDVARALGVSINTVKYHLKSIYAKTGASHKSELVVLLLNCLVQTNEGLLHPAN